MRRTQLKILFGLVLCSGLVIYPAYTTSLMTTTPVLTVSPGPESVSKTTPPHERLVLTGDVMLGRHVEFLMSQRGANYPFVGVRDWLKATGTKTVINFESAMATPHVRTPAYTMQFSTNAYFLEVLTEINVVAASLANNHSSDYGVAGYTKTVEALAANNIATFGQATTFDSTAITYIAVDKVTVALVGLHTLFTAVPLEQLQSIMAVASANSDMQIAYVHWGEEYVLIHNAAQERIAHQLIDAGADLVVGHHPHVTQDIQTYNNVPILYSLGNFVFDQYFSIDVQEGLLVALQFSGSNYSLSLHPHSSVGTHSQPYLMSADSRQDFLRALAKRSDPAIASTIKAGVITGTFK